MGGWRTMAEVHCCSCNTNTHKKNKAYMESNRVVYFCALRVSPAAVRIGTTTISRANRHVGPVGQLAQDGDDVPPLLQHTHKKKLRHAWKSNRVVCSFAMRASPAAKKTGTVTKRPAT